MTFSSAELRMVDDHIAQGERHVSRQHEIIAWLKSRGHPTDVAEDLLAEFEATLIQHRAHREVMLLENEADPLDPKGRARAPRRALPSPKPD